MIDSPLALLATIAGVVVLALWLERRRVPGLWKLGATLLAIAIGGVLSNVGLVPPASPIYQAITGTVTDLAIVWLLLAVNLADLRKAGGAMLVAFGIAVVGTALGAFAGAFLFGGAIGEETWKLAGALTGTYSGGSLNFTAVSRAVDMSDALFVGATAADNVVTGLWLAACVVLPRWIGRYYPAPPSSPDAPPASPSNHPGRDPDLSDDESAHPLFAGASVSTHQLAILVAAGLAIMIASRVLATVTPAINPVLWLTTLALATGHAMPSGAKRGALQLGNLALLFFFVVIGVYSRIAEVLAVGVQVLFYALFVVAVHGVLVFLAGRFLRVDIGTLCVASQASVGGPGSALAVAVAGGWRSLILPGILVGLLGYALGTYAGMGIAQALRGFGF
ncbi:MAG: DUF819 family protein [Gammaproteobacteria bacterium]|nr:DUF819 family protein [Gammaproteobacteria bacterium]